MAKKKPTHAEIAAWQDYATLRDWIDAGPALIGRGLYMAAQREMNARMKKMVDNLRTASKGSA